MRRQGRVGFVPTMGALHEGHLSLVRLCRRHSDLTVVSVFVNPTQFGPGEDFERYPRDFRRDRALLAQEGVEAVFHPSVEEIYPEGACTTVSVRGLTDGLCGRFRPGHFDGVATVVAALFNIVRPVVAVFGRKDFQQVAVIRRMVRDLAFPVKVVTAPTVREPDGLAMSSRNGRLSPRHRREAPVLYRALRQAQAVACAGEQDPEKIRSAVRRFVEDESCARVQYVEIVGADDLKPLRRVKGRVVVALAALFGAIRLVDNVTFRVPNRAGSPAGSGGPNRVARPEKGRFD